MTETAPMTTEKLNQLRLEMVNRSPHLYLDAFLHQINEGAEDFSQEVLEEIDHQLRHRNMTDHSVTIH